MASLNIENFGDLLKATLSHFDEPDYTNLVTDLTDHPFAKRMAPKASMKIKSGKSCVFKVRMLTGNSFANISPTDHDQVNIVDGLVDGEVQWRKSGVKYAFLDEEVSINMNPQRLIDLIKMREDGADQDWIEGLEGNGWNFPSASDTLTPFGLPYWIPKNATEGFNGGVPSGYTSTVAGISPTTYSRWNNYTGQYTDVTLDDLISKARTMADKTNFKPMVRSVPDAGGDTPNRSYVTNLTVRQKFADVADGRNDNLGPDVSKMDSEVTFRRSPLEYAPMLDRDSTNPLYQLDWRHIKIYVQTGWWQKRTVLSPYPGQRNMTGVFMDSLYQIICRNRRTQGVLATGTTYPS